MCEPMNIHNHNHSEELNHFHHDYIMEINSLPGHKTFNLSLSPPFQAQHKQSTKREREREVGQEHR